MALTVRRALKTWQRILTEALVTKDPAQTPKDPGQQAGSAGQAKPRHKVG